jgi:hypothetical protein
LLAVQPGHGGDSLASEREREKQTDRAPQPRLRRGGGVGGGRKRRGGKARCFRVQPAAAAASVGGEREKGGAAAALEPFSLPRVGLC